MNKPFTSITDLVLAGGKSSRMGQDKGLLPLQGKPIVQWMLEALTPCADHIKIVATDSASAKLQRYPHLFQNINTRQEFGLVLSENQLWK